MSNLSEDEINTQLAEFESTFTQCEYNSEQVQNRLDAFREWAALKFQQLQRKSDAETLRSEIETKQQEVNNGFTNNLAELSAQIDQLRLEVQAAPPPPPPPSAEPHFFFNSKSHLPSFDPCDGSLPGSASVQEVFDFLTLLEQEFRLRNYELQLSEDSTAGWAKYAILQLVGEARIWATFKWGFSPNISWETFRKSVMDNFITDVAVQNLEREYEKLDCYPNFGTGCPSLVTDGSILILNKNFRELGLLMTFVGKGIPEKTAIKHYVEKIAHNEKVALALSQAVAVERIMEGPSASMSLDEVMRYCENVDNASRGV